MFHHGRQGVGHVGMALGVGLGLGLGLQTQ